MIVYLSGPMIGLTWPEAMGWRRDVSKRLTMLGYDVLVPGRTEERAGTAYKSTPMPPASAADLLKLDALDVRNADILLVNLLQITETMPLVGSSIEIGIAHALNHTILVIGDKAALHPFIVEAATKVVETVEEALSWMERIKPYTWAEGIPDRERLGFPLPHQTHGQRPWQLPVKVNHGSA